MLSDGHSFAIFDAGGDIVESPLEALGLFHRDTRYLSRFELRVSGETPYFLNSFLSDDKAQLRVNLTNPDLGVHGEVIDLPRNSIQLERSWALGQASLFHRLVVRNYTQAQVKIDLEFRFAVDFVDLFEVRGVKREHHGEMLEPEHHKDSIRFQYRGLDHALRFSDMHFAQAPTELDSDRALYSLTLAAEAHATLDLGITCGNLGDEAAAGPKQDRPDPPKHPGTFDHTLQGRRAQITRTANGWAKVSATNELMNSLIRNSDCDLMSIMSHDAGGTYIMAGIPWFATLVRPRQHYHRACRCCRSVPSIAARTLRTLARFQGTRSQPGAR